MGSENVYKRQVFYGFGDASAAGHASNFQGFRKMGTEVRADSRIHYRYGHWCDETSEESSNYRELLNLVESLEAQVESGTIRGAEWLRVVLIGILLWRRSLRCDHRG